MAQPQQNAEPSGPVTIEFELKFKEMEMDLRIRQIGPASVASYLAGALTVASLGVGVAIAIRLHVQSGMGVAASDPNQLQAVAPLLMIAEGLKICLGAVLIVVALPLAKRSKNTAVEFALAAIAALLLIAAGSLGIVSLSGLNGGLVSGPMLGKTVAWLGLLSLPVTGAWASFATRSARTPAWISWLASSLALLGAAALFLPPVGMIFGVISIVFWFAFARALRRVDPEPA